MGRALEPTAGEHQIHKLVDQEWQTTSVALDDRSRSHGDYLWDGEALYLASVSGDTQAAPILVFRYTYNASTDTYALDPAFVENQDADVALEEGRIAGQGPSESVTIAKDSTGQLWITYTANVPATTTRNVMINSSQAAGQHAWGTPFVLSSAPAITDDDISAVVQFGTSIGVMWTDQNVSGGTGFGFSTHPDGNADGAWTGAEVAASNAAADFADDHVSLRATADGRVLAAVKTNAGPDHIQLLVRATTGAWTATVVVGEGIPATRPRVVVDGTNNLAYVLYTIPVLAGDTMPFPNQSIFHKSASLAGAPTFELGNGTPFITESGIDINDISTSKHSVATAVGLLGVAASETNDTYYHGFLPLVAEPAIPPTPTGLGGSAASTSQINLAWNASAGATSYGVYRDGGLVGTPTGTTFSDTGLAAGTSYSYTVDAANASGRSPRSAAVSIQTMADPAVRDVGRIFGPNRYATAAELSKVRFPTPPSTLNVFVATGLNFPDALSAAPAAGFLDGPILLVTTSGIPAETKTELTRLGPSKIYVVGGPSVISEVVRNELIQYTDSKLGTSVERVSGANRYATAAAVSNLFPTNRTAVFVATGRNFPDALAAGPAATLTDAPVLLVDTNSIPGDTAAALTWLSPTTIYVVGGNTVVTDSVRGQLAAYTDSGSAGSVVRLSGPNRFATGVEITKQFWPGTAARTTAATGLNFPDALAGGAYPIPLHLVRQNEVPDPVGPDVARLDPSRIDVLGSSGVVSDGVVNTLRAL